ncbi:hypothetical protein [Bradyrhizobium sp. 150]|uniref:hypothetical protein n=1 Tax=Bradyrhizobium sp. 150 TaxID=2782625 RepID=UPI001FF99763|nr:hypothetical protein [Bradyrhizobium sp. 150]MCK1670331.1 hypothetical protein [Bradyrhizobium sp. 150]
MPVPHADFHEVWWIYSPINGKEWAGLRIAHFRKTTNGVLICTIANEIDPRRIGVRVWEDIQQSELWYKVKQVPIPNLVEVMAAALPLPDEELSSEADPSRNG